MSFLEKLLFYPYPLRVLIAYKVKSRLRGFIREHYYTAIHRAALEGVQLGCDRLSVIEFGVANGAGLLEIEAICTYVERRFPITFDVFGFDSGQGLPKTDDWRDRPWQWSEGWYDMDVARLGAKLKRARLVIGDVAETVPRAMENGLPSPVGAVMFDLDYYSSTKAALAVLSHPDHRKTLPRVLCYLDDIGAIEDVGVMRAISEFNEEHETRKVKPFLSRQLLTLDYDVRWKMFEYHDFEHPLYSTLIREENPL